MQASKKGLFIGCTAYPKCDYTRPLSGNEEGPTILGQDPGSAQNILLLSGRYGPYVQIGETPEDKKIKPRRASWPKEIPLDQADLATALKLLSLPREVGHHPQTGLPIVANIGRFGPYLLHDGKFKSIPKADDVYTIRLERALEVLAMERAPRAGADGGEGKNLGTHPEDDKPVQLLNGRYGWYIKHGKINATVPKNQDPESITLEEAIALIAEKSARGPGKRPAARKAATKKKAADRPVKAPAAKRTARQKAS
jgi:DNA topoisomerase-1